MNETIEILDAAISLDSGLMQRSASKILLLPEDLTSALPIYAGTTESVLKLFRQNGFEAELAVATPSPAWRDNRSSDWFAPTLLVSQLLITQNPEAVSVALNIISNYITDFFKGVKTDPSVKLTVVFERDGCSKKIQYKGPVSGLGEIGQVIKRLSKK